MHFQLAREGWLQAWARLRDNEAEERTRIARELHDITAHHVAVIAVHAEAGQALLAAHPEVDILISDDGLQHYALARDVEIVLFDGRGAGNGWLLPAGPQYDPEVPPAGWGWCRVPVQAKFRFDASL